MIYDILSGIQYKRTFRELVSLDKVQKGEDPDDTWQFANEIM